MISQFNEVKNKDLRIRNRAVVMANIFEDGIKPEGLNNKTALALMNYYRDIPADEKGATYVAYAKILEERGFVPHG